jgi:hypothetical protein
MRRTGLCWLLAGSLVWAGCGGGGGGDDGEGGTGGDSGSGATGGGTPLDPDAPPVVQGDWSRPTVATTWQWQLKETVNTSYDVDVYDIDLFDSQKSLITELKGLGRTVICYFSAGSSEEWRPDFAEFQSGDMGAGLEGWEGERWLDVRSTNVHRIMLARLDLAKTKGCDGVEPDNVDGYANETGFDLTERDQLAFNRFVANEAHGRGLAIGLKNDGGQAEPLVAYYDFELNEQCHEYDECGDLSVFTENGKPILNAEYTQEDTLDAANALAVTVCPAAQSADIRTLILPWELDDSFRVSCEP